MKVIKLSEHVYAASFSNLHASYLNGFPQREKQLLSGMQGLEVHWFKHPPLVEESVVEQARTELKNYVTVNKIDFILFDNPLSFKVIDDKFRQAAIFDCCDWYLDYYVCEFGENPEYNKLCAEMNAVLSQCPSMIFQSPTMEAWAREKNPHSEIRSIVLPNGCNPDIFYAGKSNVDFDRKTALFAGKLGRWYEGLKTIARGLPDGWQLLLVGDGPCRKEFTDFPRVHCTGPLCLPEVGDYMRAADVCVFPVDDCSPIATSEYLACGKPVVHRGDRIAWMIQNGVNGYLTPDNADSWRQKIVEASNSSAELRRLALQRPKTWNALQRELHAWLREGR